MRLDADERVLEAAERQAAVDALVEQQRLLQPTVPIPSVDPPGDAWMHLQSLVDDEREGAAMGVLARLGLALQRLLSAYEAGLAADGHSAARQLAQLRVTCEVEAWANAAEHAAQGRGAERLERAADPVFTMHSRGTG
jgi:hypothetical protein